MLLRTDESIEVRISARAAYATHTRVISWPEPATIAFHFGVVAEALRSDIRQIAEGHSVIRHELQEMRNEFRNEFKGMRALVPLSFAQLDQLRHPPL